MRNFSTVSFERDAIKSLNKFSKNLTKYKGLHSRLKERRAKNCLFNKVSKFLKSSLFPANSFYDL